MLGSVVIFCYQCMKILAESELDLMTDSHRSIHPNPNYSSPHQKKPTTTLNPVAIRQYLVIFEKNH